MKWDPEMAEEARDIMNPNLSPEIVMGRRIRVLMKCALEEIRRLEDAVREANA